MGNQTPTRRRWLWNPWSGLVMLAVCAVLGWLFMRGIQARKFNAILTEISSIGDFRKNTVVNHSASLLWYARNEEKGVGIQQIDLKTLSRQKVSEVNVVDEGGDYFSLFGCSPDDHYLLLAQTPDSSHIDQELIIRDNRTGSAQNKINVHASIEQAVWLAADSFAFLDSSKSLHVYEFTQEVGADSGCQEILTRQLDPSSAGSLLAMSARRVAYVERGNIQCLDLKTGVATQLSPFTDVAFEWLNYSPENDNFLFCWTDRKKSDRRHLYRYHPAQGGNGVLAQLTFNAEHTYNGQWIQRGTGFAYVGNPGNFSYLAIRPRDDSCRTNLFRNGYVRSFSVSPAGEKVYAVASLGAEPQGIWEYDIGRKMLRCVLPGTNRPFVASKIITPLKGIVELTNGSKIDYFLLPPRDFHQNRKYPLVIDGPSESRWKPHSQFLANVGIYYVAVNRRGLASSDDLADADQDILAVYEKLLKNPAIDRKRVFISGFSAATQVASLLVERHPELWRGVILNSPIDLPPLSHANARYPSIFLSIGEKDDSFDLAKRFVEQAKGNVFVETVFYPNTGHMLRNTELVKDLNGRLARFVLEN